MPAAWQKWIAARWKDVRDLALVACVVGGLQVLVSLLIWQVLFRSYPMGLSMALTLVGFGGWLISFFACSRSSGRAPLGMRPWGGVPGGGRPQDNLPLGSALPDRAREQLERSGCGCLLVVSSLIPLGIALALRLMADFRVGKTWSDIFPPMP